MHTDAKDSEQQFLIWITIPSLYRKQGASEGAHLFKKETRVSACTFWEQNISAYFCITHGSERRNDVYSWTLSIQMLKHLGQQRPEQSVDWKRWPNLHWQTSRVEKYVFSLWDLYQLFNSKRQLWLQGSPTHAHGKVTWNFSNGLIKARLLQKHFKIKNSSLGSMAKSLPKCKMY